MPVFIDLTPEQVALRAELRAYFAGLMSAGERAAMRADRHGQAYRDVVRRMGRDGWLGVGWPAEYGGRGFGQMEQQIFADEALRADVPLPSVTLQTVGPTLLEHGTREQKDFFLPKILAGEIHFAIGYTEPEAGTDLAALRTRAVRDGDEYVVNGQKTFTTGAHEADYIWLACRTAPDAPPRPEAQANSTLRPEAQANPTLRPEAQANPTLRPEAQANPTLRPEAQANPTLRPEAQANPTRHRGISILIVDTRDPGFSWTPIITHDGAHHVNATYYSDVRVPAGMLVGEENGGWRLITTQLNHERVMLGPAGRIAALHDRVQAWAAARSLLDVPEVARALYRAAAVLRVNELLNWQVASRQRVDVADASATKVFSSVQLMSLGPLLADVVGRHGDPADQDTEDVMDWLDVQVKRNTVLTFGGGVNEIQRELIATAGLGLPRAPR
jgi:alkylation response protein AidB-like acyl-CoA dehydrogenase